MSGIVDERSTTEGAVAGDAVALPQSCSISRTSLTLPCISLAALGAACCAVVAFANLRHNGTLSFPIDDSYIYSNYVLSASRGHIFTYNPGEASGGITSLAWYLLCTLVYWLVAPFHNLLGGLAPSVAQGDQELSRSAGHLYLAAYIPGMISLVATMLGAYRLSLLVLPLARWSPSARNAFCWLLAAATGANLGVVWGAMSGLEIPLSTAVAAWAVVLLIEESRRGTLRWALVLAALLPWVRPDLLAMSGAGVLWLAWRGVRGPYPKGGASAAFSNAAAYFLAIVAGTGLMALIYHVGWGRPLSSSFYAKVRELRLGDKFWFAGRSLVDSRGSWPLLGAGLAAAGGILQWLAPARHEGNEEVEWEAAEKEYSSAALLLLLIVLLYVPSLMLTIPWFGQEERYLLPIYPFATVLVGMLVWRALQYLPHDALVGNRLIRRVGGITVSVVLVLMVYLWATQLYVVDVRNIRDAHITPSVWLSANTPADSVVASEPIGAIKLFSGRRTFDIVGLTSPSALGSFEDWPRSWEVIRESGASYLLFYKDWFDNVTPPPWAVELKRFDVPDNHIAGSDQISVYRLRWDLYTPLKP